MYEFSLIFCSMAVLALSYVIYGKAEDKPAVCWLLLMLILNVSSLTGALLRGAV